jgi:hypothetical protein
MKSAFFLSPLRNYGKLVVERTRERERSRNRQEKRKRDQPCILNVPTYNPVPRLVKVDKGER